jgi:hypothetical protein
VGHLAAQLRKDEAGRAKKEGAFLRKKTRRLSIQLHGMHTVQEKWLQHIYLCRCSGLFQRALSESQEARKELARSAGTIQGFWKIKYTTGKNAKIAVSSLPPEIRWRWSLNVRCFKRKFAAQLTRDFLRRYASQKLRITVHRFRRDVILMQQWMRSWVQVLHARLTAMNKRVAKEEEKIYRELLLTAAADLKQAEANVVALPGILRMSDEDEADYTKRVSQLAHEKHRVECGDRLQRLRAVSADVSVGREYC